MSGWDQKYDIEQTEHDMKMNPEYEFRWLVGLTVAVVLVIVAWVVLEILP